MTLITVRIRDLAANRPAFGIAGRLFIASDTGAWSYDTGAAWVTLSAGPPTVSAKGDLQGYSTLPASVPVGANNTVLIADSTQALGVKWGPGVVADPHRRAVMWHDESSITVGATPLNAVAFANQEFYTLSNIPTPANGDTFTQSFVLDAGTYTLYILGNTNTSRGKIDWYIDNVSIATGQDWYSGGAGDNTIKTVAGLVITAGYHVLKGVVNGKNASSSGYYIYLTKYWFKPATD